MIPHLLLKVFGLSFLFAIIQGNASSLGPEEAIHAFSSKINSNELNNASNNQIPLISEETCRLVMDSYLLIEPYLEQEDFSIYAEDVKFTQAFPFSSYTLISVPLQGSFYINDIDDSIKNHLRKKLCWEPKNQSIISEYIKPGSIAIDIGAHIGTHTVTMDKCVGENGRVLAFEPNRKIYRELCYNLVANDCKNTYPIRTAVGKTKSIIEVVTSHPRNEGGSYVVNAKGGSETAVLLPLDIFDLNNVSFIKIDVENMEADVLDGARSTILRNKPVMLIEIQGNGERPVQLGEDTKQMGLISIKKIVELGYTIVPIENSVDCLAFPNN